MAMTLAEAERMLDACRASGTKLTVNHQRYYEPPYVRARELLNGGAIGPVRCVEAHCRASTVLGDGTHVIHMLMSLLGWPGCSHVLAQLNRLPEGAAGRKERGGAALLAVEKGPYAYLTWGAASEEPPALIHPRFGERFYQSLGVHGDRGRIEGASDGPEDERRRLHVLRGARVENIECNDPALVEAREIEDLIRSIETGSPHPLSGQTGRDVMEIIEAILRSAERGSAVRVQGTGRPA